MPSRRRTSSSSARRWPTPADRATPGGEVAGLAALGLRCAAVCPVLQSVGAGVRIAGLGLRIWLLALAGVIVVVPGSVVLLRRRRANCAAPDDPGGC